MINNDFVDLINAKKAPVIENGLQDLIDKSEGRLSATHDIKKAIMETDVTFIIVPTPSDVNGRFSMKYAVEVAKNIGLVLKNKPSYHVVVMTSTTMPGDTESKFITTLEEASGKKCSAGFDVCYNPEFIALGSVVSDMLNPDMILIGESSQKAGDILEEIYKKSTSNSPYFARMNIINAEITKISVNTYVTAKISYANMIAQICMNAKGANANIVLNAVGKDSRIGNKYLLNAGMPFGGPCFPRDNIAMGKFAEDVGVAAIVSNATDKMNSSHAEYIANLVKKLSKNKQIALLGLSYKPNTPVIDVSPSIAIAKLLNQQGFSITAYDSLAIENAQKELKINYVNNIKDALKNADLVIIGTNAQEFQSIDPLFIKNDAIILDCWGILNPNNYSQKIIQIGVYF
jgi:UDPglucose 6-dehydrogenase